MYGVLVDRTTGSFSRPEAIKAEMEEMRQELADYPDDLDRLLHSMAEDLAFSESLYGKPAA